MRQKEREAGGRRAGREGRWRGKERRHRGRGKGLIGERERIEDVELGTMRGGINAHASFFCIPPPFHTSHTHAHTHTHTHTHTHLVQCLIPDGGTEASAVQRKRSLQQLSFTFVKDLAGGEERNWHHIQLMTS